MDYKISLRTWSFSKIGLLHFFCNSPKYDMSYPINGILIANGYCPISFRTVDSVDYKKAMLMLYEQNNIAAFKRIFIEQFLSAVKTYF